MHAWRSPDNHAGFRADLISCASELTRLVCKLGGEMRAASPMRRPAPAKNSTPAGPGQPPQGAKVTEAFTYDSDEGERKEE